MEERRTVETDQPQPTPYRKVILISLAVGLLSILIARQLSPTSSKLHPWVGERLPTFELDPLVNTDQPLASENVEQKVLLINFWGPWCSPCIAEFPDLLKARRKYGQWDDFQLVSVSCGQEFLSTVGGTGMQEDLAKLENDTQLILAQFNSDLPVYTDTTARFRLHISANTKWSGYPTTILVGRNGEILEVWNGYQPNFQAIEDSIEQALQPFPATTD